MHLSRLELAILSRGGEFQSEYPLSRGWWVLFSGCGFLMLQRVVTIVVLLIEDKCGMDRFLQTTSFQSKMCYLQRSVSFKMKVDSWAWGVSPVSGQFVFVFFKWNRLKWTNKTDTSCPRKQQEDGHIDPHQYFCLYPQEAVPRLSPQNTQRRGPSQAHCH